MSKRVLNNVDYYTDEPSAMTWELLKQLAGQGKAFYTEEKRLRDIENGEIFTWQTAIPINNASTRYFWWDTSLSSNYITFDPLLLFATAGTVTLNFYINHNYKGGTEQIIYNRNYKKYTTHKTKTKVYIDPTGTEKGTLVSIIDVGTQATNQSSGGGSIQSPDKVIVDNPVTFLVEAVNSSGQNTRLNVLLTFHEKLGLAYI